MNAPLSRFLVRFDAEPAMEGLPAAAVAEPMVTLRVAELDARLDEARAGARAAAEDAHALAIAELGAGHETAVADAVATARAAWVGVEADGLLARVDGALASMRESFAEAIAEVLRPVVADAVRERALEALGAATARLLADPSHPAITLHAPADLVEAIRARGVPDTLKLVVADRSEAVVSADGTHIETRLAAALADLAALER